MRKTVFVVVALCACSGPGPGGTGGGGSSTAGGSGASAGGSATAGGSGSSAGGATAGGTGGTAGGSVSMDAGVTGCAKPNSPDPDRVRKVVVSHPYPGDGGNRDNLYEVLELQPTGALSTTGTYFRMGRASGGEGNLVFTPDGRFGYVVQDDGSLGIFELGGDGGVTVLNASYRQGFYARNLLMARDGDYLWVVDFNTRGNGGGLYEIALLCDGTPVNNGPMWAGDSPGSGVLLPGPNPTALVAARTLGSSAMADVLHKVDLFPAAATNNYRAGAAAFPDTDGIYSQVAVSPDQVWVAVTDNGSFSGGDRVAIVRMTGDMLMPVQVVATPSPIGVAWSPFGRTALIVNSDAADHFRLLTQSGTTWSVGAPIPYAFGRPQLPGQPIVITRGLLNGRVLVPELNTIRQLQFETDGGIRDVSETPVSFTGSMQSIGAMGVWP